MNFFGHVIKSYVVPKGFLEDMITYLPSSYSSELFTLFSISYIYVWKSRDRSFIIMNLTVILYTL